MITKDDLSNWIRTSTGFTGFLIQIPKEGSQVEQLIMDLLPKNRMYMHFPIHPYDVNEELMLAVPVLAGGKAYFGLSNVKRDHELNILNDFRMRARNGGVVVATTHDDLRLRDPETYHPCFSWALRTEDAKRYEVLKKS